MRSICTTCILLLLALTSGCVSVIRPGAIGPTEDRWASYVWPPPPDQARIRLVDIISQRSDVEAGSRLAKALMGANPRDRLQRLRRPIAVAMDEGGRVYVSDIALHAVVRFDREHRRVDLLGTTGSVRLRVPLGVSAGHDGQLYVADAGLRRVVVFDEEGRFTRAYGRDGELINPTDAELSPDGRSLYVADSQSHQIVVFDAESGSLLRRIGSRGSGAGELNYPTALAFDRDGSLFVLDQMNSRVQILGSDGEFLDAFGSLGTGFGQFVRPKGLAIDSSRFIYVTDAAFNNIQIFDSELRLLTFVGDAGGGPGQFRLTGGVAASGNEFAVVDQLGRRVQIFRFLPGAR